MGLLHFGEKPYIRIAAEWVLGGIFCDSRDVCCQWKDIAEADGGMDAQGGVGGLRGWQRS